MNINYHDKPLKIFMAYVFAHKGLFAIDMVCALAVAVIEAESGYDPGAVSDCGDYGLMQINKICHGWLGAECGVTDWLDPYQNARAGVYLLGEYWRDYGYESGTLMAYNMGREAAEELFARGIYATDYSDRVIGIRGRLEAENG